MEDRKIRRNLYRVLRKTGVEKKNINVNATFQEDFRFDTIDWTIFTYFLTFLWIAINWFYFRPKSIKKQDKAINELIEKFGNLSSQLKKEDQ